MSKIPVHVHVHGPVRYTQNQCVIWSGGTTRTTRTCSGGFWRILKCSGGFGFGWFSTSDRDSPPQANFFKGIYHCIVGETQRNYDF